MAATGGRKVAGGGAASGTLEALLGDRESGVRRAARGAFEDLDVLYHLGRVAGPQGDRYLRPTPMRDEVKLTVLFGRLLDLLARGTDTTDDHRAALRALVALVAGRIAGAEAV